MSNTTATQTTASKKAIFYQHQEQLNMITLRRSDSMQSYYFVMDLIYKTGTWVLLKYLYYKIHLILCKHSASSEITIIGLNKAKVISIQKHMWFRVIPLVSRAHQWGQVHPHRQDMIRVGMHIHSQGKLHIWSLNVVNSSAVHRLNDGPNLRERQMQGESWNLKKEKKGLSVVIYSAFFSLTLSK